MEIIRQEAIDGVKIIYTLAKSLTPLLLAVGEEEKPQEVNTGYYDFSKINPIYTRGAFICNIIAARLPDSWALYHGYVQPYRGRTGYLEQYELDHLKRLMKFLHTLREKNNPYSRAFLFGANEWFSARTAFESRSEAERLLIVTAGFRRENLTARWNNTHNSMIDVIVNPAASTVIVRGPYYNETRPALDLIAV